MFDGFKGTVLTVLKYLGLQLLNNLYIIIYYEKLSSRHYWKNLLGNAKFDQNISGCYKILS